MYTYLFTNVLVKISFNEFEMEELHEFNMVPTQLHPNSWVTND